MNETGFSQAIRALEEAAIPYRFRKGWTVGSLPAQGEVDISMDPADVGRADRALRAAGFRVFVSPRDRGHRFYLAFARRRWLKLDAKLEPAGGAARRNGSFWHTRIPGLRRRTPMVAILGPDGAGKGTLIAGLRRAIPVGVASLYLGMDAGRGDQALPIWAKRSHASEAAGTLREVAGLAYRVLRAWRMLLPGYLAAWRGRIVLCDRHPIEVLAVRPDRTTPGRIFERFAARWLIPWPDAIVILDAPGSVLFRRKGEHSVERLDELRRGYAEVFGANGATVLQTTGSRRATLARASEVVWEALARRRGW